MRPRGSASPTVVAICHQPASSFHAAQPCTPHRVPERYARCHPEQTPLYRIGTRHLEIWLAERSLGEHPVAVHIEEELRSYLRCGILSFGSALNRHVHLHVCVTDGFFCSDATGDQEDAGDPSVRFFAARPITPGDLDTLTARVPNRLIRWFRRAGLLDAAAAADMLGWEHSGLSIDASVWISLDDPPTTPESRGPSCLRGLPRRFRSSARCAAATSG